MTVCVTSDWHLNDKPRDRYRHEWQKQLRKLIVKHRVHTLLMLGDLTDEFDNHPASLVNEIVTHLTNVYQLLALCPVCGGSGFFGQGTGYGDVCGECGGQRHLRRPEIYVMRGNHDYVNPDCPFFKFVGELDQVRWINEPCMHKIEGLGRALFLPHTRDYKKDWKDVDFNDADICFAHNTFAGTIAESGKQLGGIPLSAIPANLPVISGDIHKRQNVGHVTYVGSPYTIDFGDSFKPRVLLLEDGIRRSIPCTGPQKQLIEPKSEADLVAALKEAGTSKNIIKLRVQLGGAQERGNWAAIKRSITEEALAYGVRLHAVEAVTDQPTKRSTATPRKRQRDEEVLKEYCQGQGITDAAYKVGLDIMKRER